MCEGYDVQAAGVAAVGLSAELHPAATALATFFASSGAGLLLGAAIGGRIADRHGRKPVLLASLATFGLFALLTAQARDMQTLTVARFLTGLGLGGAMPNVIALSADASGPKSRNASIATTYIGMPLGAVVSALVVLVIPRESWRIVFQIGGIAPLLLAPAMAVLMPAMRPAPAHATLGADDTWPAVVGRRTGVTARGGFGTDESHRPAAPLVVLFGGGRAGGTLLLWTGFFLVVLTLHLMLNWLPLLLFVRGLAGLQVAAAQIIFNVGGATLALLAGWLLDTPRHRTAVVSAIVLLPVVMFYIARSGTDVGATFALIALMSGAILAQQVILFAVGRARYEPSARGMGLGAAVAAGRVGTLAGPLFAGWLIAAGRSPDEVLLGVLPVTVLCGLCTGVLTLRGIRRG